MYFFPAFLLSFHLLPPPLPPQIETSSSLPPPISPVFPFVLLIDVDQKGRRRLLLGYLLTLILPLLYVCVCACVCLLCNCSNIKSVLYAYAQSRCCNVLNLSLLHTNIHTHTTTRTHTNTSDVCTSHANDSAPAKSCVNVHSCAHISEKLPRRGWVHGAAVAL